MTSSLQRVFAPVTAVAEAHTSTTWPEPAPELSAGAHALWDALHELPASQVDQALQHLLAGLCRVFRASSASWAGVTQTAEGEDDDAMHGWRCHAQRRVHIASDFALDALKMRRDAFRDLSLVRYLERAGSGFRVQRWSELADSSWFESDYFRMHYGRSIGDAVYVGFPLTSSCESMFTVLRAPDAPAFSDRERDGIGYTLRGLKRFHRQLMLSFGLIDASAKLTNTERKVLLQLLTGRTEKEVAQELGLSYHTTHAHVASILKKFGVGNRPSLMALWLG